MISMSLKYYLEKITGKKPCKAIGSFFFLNEIKIYIAFQLITSG